MRRHGGNTAGAGGLSCERNGSHSRFGVRHAAVDLWEVTVWEEMWEVKSGRLGDNLGRVRRDEGVTGDPLGSWPGSLGGWRCHFLGGGRRKHGQIHSSVWNLKD